MENVLEVKKLGISFRTNSGTVKAVRDISFNLKRGETLAIVGESGSGKSVTSKAVLGILAGNSIIESGEILYDGKDLLKISEEEMCKIRGDKISMIFQDPLSSLDPIVKIGKQITEAMLLKNKLSRKMGRLEFKILLKELAHNMAEAAPDCKEEIRSLVKAFDAFSVQSNKLDEKFMHRFIELEALGIKNSHERSQAAKRKVLTALGGAREYFEGTSLVKAEAYAKARKLSALVADSIDKLQYEKDSVAGSFAASLNNQIDKYFCYKKHNPREEARYARRSAKRKALIARGRGGDRKVVPKAVYDLDILKKNIILVIDRLCEKYEADISASAFDYTARALGLIDYLKEKAAQAVYRVTKSAAKETAVRLMDEVGIPEPHIRYNQYPFEFSGGMRQRMVIAIALAANPDILICDEPTTALDVTIQSQILELINKLKAERGLSVIFITHDLGVVANMADRIAVMYAGKIVEQGTADDVFYDPRHPYTWALLSSMPDLDTNEKLDAIPGTPPNMIYPPEGDAFAARNKYALKIDFEEQPPEFRISETHTAATWLLHPDAPKVEVPKIITDRIQRMKKNAGERENG